MKSIGGGHTSAFQVPKRPRLPHPISEICSHLPNEGKGGLNPEPKEPVSSFLTSTEYQYSPADFPAITQWCIDGNYMDLLDHVLMKYGPLQDGPLQFTIAKCSYGSVVNEAIRCAGKASVKELTVLNCNSAQDCDDTDSEYGEEFDDASESLKRAAMQLDGLMLIGCDCFTFDHFETILEGVKGGNLTRLSVRYLTVMDSLDSCGVLALQKALPATRVNTLDLAGIVASRKDGVMLGDALRSTQVAHLSLEGCRHEFVVGLCELLGQVRTLVSLRINGQAVDPAELDAYLRSLNARALPALPINHQEQLNPYAVVNWNWPHPVDSTEFKRVFGVPFLRQFLRLDLLPVDVALKILGDVDLQTLFRLRHVDRRNRMTWHLTYAEYIKDHKSAAWQFECILAERGYETLPMLAHLWRGSDVVIPPEDIKQLAGKARHDPDATALITVTNFIMDGAMPHVESLLAAGRYGDLARPAASLRSIGVALPPEILLRMIDIALRDQREEALVAAADFIQHGRQALPLLEFLLKEGCFGRFVAVAAKLGTNGVGFDQHDLQSLAEHALGNEEAIATIFSLAQQCENAVPHDLPPGRLNDKEPSAGTAGCILQGKDDALQQIKDLLINRSDNKRLRTLVAQVIKQGIDLSAELGDLALLADGDDDFDAIAPLFSAQV